jgi:hypothetical protein
LTTFGRSSTGLLAVRAAVRPDRRGEAPGSWTVMVGISTIGLAAAGEDIVDQG